MGDIRDLSALSRTRCATVAKCLGRGVGIWPAERQGFHCPSQRLCVELRSQSIGFGHMHGSSVMQQTAWLGLEVVA